MGSKKHSVTVSTLLVIVGACAHAPSGQTADGTAARIWYLMDQREPSAELVLATRHTDPEVRELAARALARVHPDGENGAAQALQVLLDDATPAVRREAVFALGQVRRGTGLVGSLADADPELRELAAAALGKCGDVGFVTNLLPLFADRVRRVRGAAALAVQRLLGDRLRNPTTPPDGEPRTAAIRALLAALERERDSDARWHFVYALAHLADPSAESALLGALQNGSREEKVFAARGLSALPVSEAIRTALLAALVDPAPSVVVEAATALASPERQLDPARRKSEGTLYPEVIVSAALQPLAAEHPAPAVRAIALKLMGRCGTAARFGQPPSDPNLLAAQLEGQARARLNSANPGRVVPDAAGLAQLDWRVRIAWARLVPGELALAEALLDDPDLRVRAAVIETLPRAFTSKQALPLARRALATRDILIRETLGEVVPQLKEPALVPSLASAIADSIGPEFAEARKLMLQAVATLDPSGAATRELLLRAMDDPDLVVRRAACALLKALGTEIPRERPGRQAGLSTPSLGNEIPLEFLGTRPRVLLETTRGRLAITLRPDLAPIHCWNLVRLAEAGDYDGRIFHRVVPNFVIQGGDHRGDGSGARSWQGKFLRDELNPLLFEVGTVGMPKTADPDTGGDQLFVTTVPTPHLDGRYTAFGIVTEGLELLDSVVIGDRILRATIVRD